MREGAATKEELEAYFEKGGKVTYGPTLIADGARMRNIMSVRATNHVANNTPSTSNGPKAPGSCLGLFVEK